MERIKYNLLFRWFVGLGFDDPVCGAMRPEICPVDRLQPGTRKSPGRGPKTFSKNRDRLLTTHMKFNRYVGRIWHRQSVRFVPFQTLAGFDRQVQSQLAMDTTDARAFPHF